MWRPNIRNKTFDWMGEKFAPFIDRDHFLGHSSIGLLKWNLPVEESVDNQLFEIQLLVPGFTKKELAVSIADDVLQVTGVKNRTKAALSEFVSEMESTDSFKRIYQLLPGTGRENFHATYRQGLLNIIVTRLGKKANQQNRSVKVQ